MLPCVFPPLSVWKPFLTLLPVLIPCLSGTSLNCLWNVSWRSAHLGHYLLSSFSTCARKSFAHIFHIWLQQTFFRAETKQERTLYEGANRSELKFSLSFLPHFSSFSEDLLGACHVPGIMPRAIDAKGPVYQQREQTLNGTLRWTSPVLWNCPGQKHFRPWWRWIRGVSQGWTCELSFEEVAKQWQVGVRGMEKWENILAQESAAAWV